MKKIGIIIISAILLNSCEDQLDIKPQGLIRDELIQNDFQTVEKNLISAYGILDGNLDNSDVWRSAASNWIYGEVTSDNAYKGSESGDAGSIDEFEAYVSSPSNSYIDIKWRAVYEGVSRANKVILSADIGLESSTLTQDEYNQLVGEARFLRGHYHFEAKKLWNKIPYIDETIAATIPEIISGKAKSVPNVSEGIWEKIVDDFKAAMNLLPETSPGQEAGENADGRANKWMAMTYLAKTYMYMMDYAVAKPLLNDIIEKGPYDLTPLFSDNFNAEKNNNIESIFAVQYDVNDGAGNDSNGRWGDILNFSNNNQVGAGCCGFFQPSQNLVNAFKTDASGLPLLDTFNDIDITNEELQFNKYRSENPSFDDSEKDQTKNLYDLSFIPEQGNLDPRLDRTAGRRGIDYQGFDIHKGRPWIRSMSNGGPYLPRKNVHRQSQLKTESTSGAAWTANVNQLNYVVIRFAEVLLWRAEIAASESDLNTAVQLVDRVRKRAANPDDFVKAVDGSPAANYVIEEYGTFSNSEQAVKAVEHEQRIELAMEGHRFFELVRKGKAAAVIEDYLSAEQEKLSAAAGSLKSFTKRPYLTGVSFGAGDEYLPIPQRVIDQSEGVITQN